MHSPAGPIRLCYHGGTLGDFITALPAILYWTAQPRPGGTLVLTRPAHARLLRSAGLVDEAWSLDGPSALALFGGTGDLPPFAEALVFSAETSPVVETLRKAACPHIIRQDPFPAVSVSKVDYHLSLFPSAPRPEVLLEPLRRFARQRGVQPGENHARGDLRVVIHPGSGGREKVWPFDRFRTVAAGLQAAGLLPLWVRGPAELDGEFHAREPVVTSPELEDLAGLLATSRLYVGNDSGVTHLAAACGCPTVAIFGPSDPVVWRPRGAPVRIVQPREGRDIRGVPPEAVLAAALELAGNAGRS
ncbi:MAG: hypothetical protein Kow00109_30340 [Acidobacteriota bacterium]